MDSILLGKEKISGIRRLHTLTITLEYRGGHVALR
ncbi:hypothetical protein RRG08_050276 [Elysia crispata]|uniref:Uncharacterized protein n=1 Tax=Elysia crispata TaxID=231223 RepID=A0AAE1B5C5_9GAST|nr:hypothetical protein RRG08_050276 [Elysia crispata]